MIIFRNPPNDRRYFVHKKLLGLGKAAVRTFVPGGGAALDIASQFIGGGREATTPRRAPPVRRPTARTLTARPSQFSAAEKEAGRIVKFAEMAITRGRSDRCIWPTRPDPVTGECKVFVGDRPGRDTRPLETGPGVAVGEAVMGRYGAALEPGSRIIDRAICLRGMQLGNDGLCYNRGQIKNSERMWPRGRRPLLTGGEMRAISIASRAAGRLTRTAVRLHEIGLIKKPVARKPRKKS